jgi:hypothetical protein
VRARIVRGQQRIHLQHGPLIDLRAPPQITADLEEVPVQLLEGALQAREGGIQHLLIRDEVLADEGPHVPILLPPLRGHLVHAALDAGALGLAMLRHQLRLQGGGVRLLRGRAGSGAG